ncbi:putative DNA ligase, partial [Emiliania huxleyi CCMP1516]|uniref:Uncharacterized protein n=2 Tax=Emiliania huxleyi TaxID=2903 RepID=A0A0D3I6G6_EMIH1
KQLQTSRWLELAERCCNPQTRPSGPQQNDAAVAKAARAAIADDENLDDAGKQALRRAAGRAPLQRLPLSGLAANYTAGADPGEVASVRINDTRFFLLDANSALARLRHTTYNVLDIQSGTSIADLLSN